MTGASAVQVYYDPYDFTIDDDPYPTWKRMRDELPLYFNEKYNFYALSRYEDVARELHNWETYRSGRGTTMDIILSGIELPPGIILFEDPPIHDLHRRLLSRVFTPRRMEAIEPLTRQYCVRALEPLNDSDRFDFISDIGAQIPMRTIGYLLGIPEQNQATIRDTSNSALTLTEGEFSGARADLFDNSGELFAEYIDWRADHPSDDVMTQLLNAELEENGTVRHLTRTEVLMYTGMVAGAGNETTTRLSALRASCSPITRTNDASWRKTSRSFRGRSRRCCVTKRRRPCRRARSPTTSSAEGRRSQRDRSCCCSTDPRIAMSGTSRTPTASTSTETARICRSARGCTSASALRWRACRRVWCSKKCSSAGPTGKSTTPPPRRRTPQACAAGRNCPSRSARRDAPQHRVALMDQ
jgi:hypothetical protein